MTDHHAPQKSGLGIAAGTFLPTFLGSLIALYLAVNSWSWPEGMEEGFLAFSWKAFNGVLIGGTPLLVTCFVLAWHGGALSVSDDAAPTAPLWGLIVGALCGASLAPTVGLMMGAAVGRIPTAVMFGLYAGPIVGIISWQISFFAPRFLRSS